MRLPLNEDFIRGYLFDKGTFGISRYSSDSSRRKCQYPYVRFRFKDPFFLGVAQDLFFSLGIDHVVYSGTELYIKDPKAIMKFLHEFNYSTFPVWSLKPKYEEIVGIVQQKLKKKRKV